MRPSTGCARVSRCLSDVLHPRYHLRHCFSWPYTQISRTSPQSRLWRPAGWGFGVGCAAQLSLCFSRGFSGLPAFLYLGTLSVRSVVSSCVLSTPHGFAYCKSSRERRVSSPAGQCLGCACVIPRVRPRQSSWDRASRFAPARLSRAPRPGCDSPLRPLPGVSPY